MIKICFVLFCFGLMGAGGAAPLTISNVAKEIRLQGIKHEKIVLAQALHETGNFSCTKCSLEKNNLFGFRYKKKYLEFDNWKESVAYYARWQNRHYKGGDYYKFLEDVGYATDTTYNQKLKRFNL
jgi:flagellum-specific peptidoglycan hydrolase FlgJ